MLTDFDGWHYALNYWYLAKDENDDKEFETWRESLGITFSDLGDWSKQSSQLSGARMRVEASWERMIGVKPMDKWWHFPWEKRSIQATFWVLRREHVLTVEEFVSR